MLKILNTLSGGKEEFKPISDKVVGIYSCGPTVYGRAHIGNMRSYVFADILHKTLEYLGYRVEHVINITDVGHLVSDENEGEDKMEKGARLAGKSPFDIAREYENLCWNDLRELNIQKDEFRYRRAILPLCDNIKGFRPITSDLNRFFKVNP